MTLHKALLEEVEYRVLLLQGASDTVLVRNTTAGPRLPRIRIVLGERLAEQLQRSAKEVWDVHILLLDFLPAHENGSRCVVAQLLVPGGLSLHPIPLSQVVESELSELQRTQVEGFLTGSSAMPFARLGWVDDCISWVESATQKRIASRSSIQQYNASPAYSLLRFLLEDGRHCWFKATGSPNTHELAVTRMLTCLCNGFLPAMIASRPAWNAWLMWEEATPRLSSSPDACEQLRLLESAVGAMAHLQIGTHAHCDDLLQVGAFDQRPDTLLRNIQAFSNHLDGWMELQITTRVPRIPRTRLLEIEQVLQAVLDRVQRLNIPDTIVHGDLNRGNILFDKQRCQFIDWSEVYMAHPLISLQHLLLLNKQTSHERQVHTDHALRSQYRSVWSALCDPDSFEEAFLYMPLLAIVSALYGRGSWADPNVRSDPGRQDFARSLTRALDRATREPQLLDRLCA